MLQNVLNITRRQILTTLASSKSEAFTPIIAHLSSIKRVHELHSVVTGAPVDLVKPPSRRQTQNGYVKPIRPKTYVKGLSC